MDESYPFKECKKCQVLDDCPCPDTTVCSLGTPLPPDCCPDPFRIMRNTTRRNHVRHRNNQEN